MKLDQRGKWVFGLLLGTWLLVVAWQIDEHHNVVEAAKSDLRSRSHEIAGTLNAVTRALQYHGAVFQDRLEPILNELVNNRSNYVVKLFYVGLLNTDDQPIVAVGDTNIFSHETLSGNEFWSDNHVTFVWPVEGASVSAEGVTNAPTVLFSPPRNFTNGEARGPRNPDFFRRGGRPDFSGGTNFGGFSPSNLPPFTNSAGGLEPPPMMPPGDNRRPPEREGRPRNGDHRPPWMRTMSEVEFKTFISTHELHGLVLVMSTDTYRAICVGDGWLRCIISFFAGISALGVGLAWRNIAKTADLQIRLVRASELNSHLKEMNLAAAGLAHETRNPLNIIRGQAQMVSRLPDATREVMEKSRTIVDQTDKVTAQLTEFINYSRPREVRRTKIALAAAANEVVRTLSFDIEEKQLRVEVTDATFAIEADEQLFRQVLFNLILNAIQAADAGGQIKVIAQRSGANEATLEIRDDGPGVAVENRQEIFKPYFTTHQRGTGLGLAVVQQNVLAHGWEIVCLGNEPRGAIFRITHLKVAA
ncbi:MAG TPA: HAMP domain-containing sensor histidine kinase [Verrucomicrobiae bacterium]|jgi:signal transduction histidine kinase